MANLPITSLPEATEPSANDYLILQGKNTQRIKWSALLDKIYPVGCIYQSTSSTSPAELFGGTWEQIKDRFILAAGDTYAAGSAGGSVTHQHVYTVHYNAKYGMLVNAEEKWALSSMLYNESNQLSMNPSMKTFFDGNSVTINQNITSASTESNRTTSYNATGSTSYQSNLPPYQVFYVWQRVA